MFKSFPEDLAKAMDRRAKLKAAGRCINAPMEDRPGVGSGIIHGPLVMTKEKRPKLGVRCEYCVLVHRHGKEVADRMWAEIQAGPDPRPFGPPELMPVIIKTDGSMVALGDRKGPRAAASSSSSGLATGAA